MTRRVDLDALKAGINRLRTKGGTDPGSLYDLLNGYVNLDGMAVGRPGTTEAVTAGLAGTIGLCAFNGGFVVFADSPKTGLPAGYTCEVLRYPNNSATPPALSKVHFANNYLGHLFVVAEFASGEIFYYWLLATGSDAIVKTWTPNTMYDTGDSVQPTTPNGFVYVVQPGPNDDLPLWQAGEQHAIGDKIQPTTRMGYYATCTNTIGDNPKSGASEPTWPAKDGALVYEDGTDAPAPATPTTPTVPPSDPGGDRYGNAGGSGGGGGGDRLGSGTGIKQF